MSYKPANLRAFALTVLVVASGLLAACGYRPLYGQTSLAPHVERRLTAITVARIPNRVGQMMRTALERRLSPTATSAPQAYELSVSLKESIAKLAVEKSGLATRANLTLKVTYRLVRLSDRLVLTKGSASSVSSYNIVNSDFATLSAETNARERAVEGLADTVRTRLAAYFHGPGTREPAQKSAQKSTRQPVPKTGNGDR